MCILFGWLLKSYMRIMKGRCKVTSPTTRAYTVPVPHFFCSILNSILFSRAWTEIYVCTTLPYMAQPGLHRKKWQGLPCSLTKTFLILYGCLLMRLTRYMTLEWSYASNVNFCSPRNSIRVQRPENDVSNSRSTTMVPLLSNSARTYGLPMSTWSDTASMAGRDYLLVLGDVMHFDAFHSCCTEATLKACCLKFCSARLRRNGD